MKALVPSVLIIGALVGWFAPAAEPSAELAETSPDEAAAPHINVAAEPQWYGGEMVLDRAADGHFYADVEVGGSNYRMLVDTGATVVALTGEDARNMGLEWDPDALAPVARGASGLVMGVPVTIPDLAVGDFVAHEVQAVIIPEGLAVSLLGQSFLGHIPKVAIADDKLTLSN